MSTLGALTAVVAERVRDAAEKLSPAAIEAAILSALEEYTRDRPREVTLAVDGTGAFDYATSAFGAAESGATASTQWAASFSRVRRLVYPYVSTERALPVLEPDQYDVVTLPAGEVLRFLDYTPTATEQFLVTFTRPHEVTVTLGTVPQTDEQAVCSLAAANALESLASYYAQATDGSLTADIVDHRGRSNIYLELARTYRQAYFAHVGRGMGGDRSAPGAAGTNVDIDRGFGGSRVPHLFHGRRLT